jgi:hypothetical protein
MTKRRRKRRGQRQPSARIQATSPAQLRQARQPLLPPVQGEAAGSLSRRKAVPTSLRALVGSTPEGRRRNTPGQVAVGLGRRRGTPARAGVVRHGAPAGWAVLLRPASHPLGLAPGGVVGHLRPALGGAQTVWVGRASATLLSRLPPTRGSGRHPCGFCRGAVKTHGRMDWNRRSVEDGQEQDAVHGRDVRTDDTR